MTADLNRLSASAALAGMTHAEVSASGLLDACLARIDEREPLLHAWATLDREGALKQAAALDLEEPRGPLHGLPIGIKDIIDTSDLPTACGSPIFAGRQPGRDAECVRRLRAAGAIILGKTVTTEFAYLDPGDTRNPHDQAHTPGGSSSGSAAAVADCHVPLALGTQTAGSIIRPAAYCGVTAYKPSFNSYSTQGIHPFAPSLDTLGSFARRVDDLVLLANTLGDERLDVRPVLPARAALLRGPAWEAAEAETARLFGSLPAFLKEHGVDSDYLELGGDFLHINEAQKYIQLHECSRELAQYYRDHRGALSEKLLGDYEFGLALDEKEVQSAYRCVNKCKKQVDSVFSAYDLVITPAAPGRAPLWECGTGDPVFNRMWTAMHLPCVSLPWPREQEALPLAIQLVGTFRADELLLSHAAGLEQVLMA